MPLLVALAAVGIFYSGRIYERYIQQQVLNQQQITYQQKLVAGDNRYNKLKQQSETLFQETQYEMSKVNASLAKCNLNVSQLRAIELTAKTTIDYSRIASDASTEGVANSQSESTTLTDFTAADVAANYAYAVHEYRKCADIRDEILLRIDEYNDAFK